MNNNKTFDPHNLTISDVFSCQAIYVIPNYQRQYSWSTEQLEELWNDLYESYENSSNECYFLGSIVVVDNGEGYHELVDGQQRLTTLMIMLNVLLKTFPNINKDTNAILRCNSAKLEQLIFFEKGRGRLQLQVDPNYNTSFTNVITNQIDYSSYKYPSQANLKKDEPEFKFINTAKFFYDRFMELKKQDEEFNRNDLDNFVNYILFKTNIIKTICTDQSFAIKLFLVLNDRGLELSVSDIIKSYILDKYDSNDKYSSYDKDTFNVNWKEIENICNNNDITIDDFMVFFEYYKLKSNPKKQVTDELKKIIQSEEIIGLVNEMKLFAGNIENIFKSTSPIIYSLRYIPWQAYVLTAIATAYQVDYPNQDELFEAMRRFFYISWISGKTLNGIKQTSFNLIQAISEKKSMPEINDLLDDFIYDHKLVRKVYEELEDNVYGEKYLKPLLLSVEYDIREEINTTFYRMDKNIHLDHILPQHFDKNMKEWSNISDVFYAKEYLDKLGNMALLQGGKNDEALNFGFDTKINIYQGKDNKHSGLTAFDTTKVIIDNYNKGDNTWDVDHIKKRQEYFIKLIENMLDISKEDFDRYVEEDEEKNDEVYPDVEDLLYLRVDNVTYATGFYKNGKIIIKAGSFVRTIESPSSYMREKVEKGRQIENIKDGKYVEDTEYDNPSSAANIILGNHKNGWIAWRNENGITLNDLVGRNKTR